MRQFFHYRKGQAIFREGEEVRGLYFIYEGAVKVHQSWGADKEFILRFARAGDVLGHRGLGGGTTCPVSATALGATTVCFISHDHLETILTANPAVLYRMMHLYVAELRKAETRMRNLALMPVKSRVADALFAIREVFGLDEEGFFRIPVTRLDIASYAGTTYEAVFRLLTEWAADGIVSTAGKSIRINDEDRLKAVAVMHGQ